MTTNMTTIDSLVVAESTIANTIMTTSAAARADVSTAGATRTMTTAATTAATTTTTMTTEPPTVKPTNIIMQLTTSVPSTTTTIISPTSSSSTLSSSSSLPESTTTSSATATFTSSLFDTSTSILTTLSATTHSEIDTSTFSFGNEIANATTRTVTEEERLRYLDSLQAETTLAYIPAIVYLVLLALIGLLGNSLVLVVYSRKFTRTSTRIFIMAIAGFDLFTNAIVIPGEIYDVLHAWNFEQRYACKTRLFFNAFTTMAAAMLLVAVAVVRYRKICHPFGKQVSVKLAKILSVTIAMLCLIFSIPYAIINGRQTKATPRPDIWGSECTIDDSYVHTIFPMLNSGFFILLFVSCGFPLVVLYILIGIKAWRHSKVYGITGHSKSGQESTTDSGCAGPGTRSTDDHQPGHVTISSRSRSYIKKKPGESTENAITAPVLEPEAKREKGGGGDKDSDKKNEFGDDEANVIELVDEDGDREKKNDEATKNNNDYSVRMVRAPTGDKVQINLSMVRELTVKLKAVQRQTGQEEEKEEEMKEEKKKEEEEGKEENKEEKPSARESSTKVVKFDDKPAAVAEIVRDEEEDLAGSNSDLDNQMRGEKSTGIQSRSCKKHSKSMDDITRLVSGDRHGKDKLNLKPKAAESEDIDLVTPRKDAATQEQDEPEEGSAPKEEEPMSEFARAMQWVDITYCLNETKDKDNGNKENDEDNDRQSKKGSFSVSRKVSRDNSFLQRHRKLRDALTDTLTRARKKIRERESAEGENKDDVTDITGNDQDTKADDLNCTKDDNRRKSNGNLVRKKSSLKDFFKGATESLSGHRKGKGDLEKQDGDNDAPAKSQTGQGQGLRRRGLGRTTLMLIIISAIYVLGFLPFLALAFIKAASPGTFQNLSLAEESLYYLFLRSYFLNSAANPIVYSLCDINFRRHCFQALRCSKSGP